MIPPTDARRAEPEAPAAPPPLRPLEPVEVRARTGSAAVRGAIVRNRGGLFCIRLERPLDVDAGRFLVRRLDDDGGAWQAECGGGLLDDGQLLLELTRPREWDPAPSRRAARFDASRAPLVFDSVVPPGVRRELVALDVSATGCRATGAGLPPMIGASVRVTLDIGSYVAQTWIHGTVVRETLGSFGRFEVGICFDPLGADERRLILAWRDAASASAQQRGPAARLALAGA